MKSVVVIDTPETCKECLFNGFNWNVCILVDEDIDEYINPNKEKPEWCPLKYLPEECDDVTKIYNTHGEVDCYQLTDYARGYNACLEEITGKEECCRNCQKWESCSCGEIGYDKGTSIGYSIGECKHYKEKQNESRMDK